MKYLRSIGLKFCPKIIEQAALYSHLHVIIWARKHGCEWSEKTCINAAKGGNIHVLRWLRGFDRNTCGLKSNEKEICPWNIAVCTNAIEENYVNVLEFALKNEMGSIFRAAYPRRAHNGSHDINECLEKFYVIC